MLLGSVECLAKSMSFPQARYAFRRAPYTPGDRDLLHACFPPLEKRFSAPADGKQASVIGWTEPERISFPATIGNRTVYHVVDIAGHFIQPHYFRTQAQNCVNLLLSAVRRIRQVLGISLRWLIPIGRTLIHVSARLNRRGCNGGSYRILG